MPLPFLLAQVAGTLELIDTSRLQARATQPLPIVGNPPSGKIALAGDASTIGTARLRLDDRRWDFTLAYSPSLTVADFELGVDPVVLNTGLASIAWHGRFVRVMVSEAASFGQVASGVPYQGPAAAAQQGAGQPGTPGQPTPPNQPVMPGQPAAPGQATLLQPNATFDLASSDTSAVVGAQTGRHETLSVMGAYRRSGGLGSAAQAYLPEQFGPRALVSFLVAPSVRDSFDTIAAGEYVVTPKAQCPTTAPDGTTVVNFCREEAPSARLQENYRHQLSATTSVLFAAGASAYEQQIGVPQAPGSSREVVVQPIASASYIERFDHRGVSTLTLVAELAPSVDPRTGLLTERLHAVASLLKSVAPRVMATASVGALQSLPYSDPYPISSLSGTLEVRTRVDKQVDLIVGAQAYWQDQSGFPPPLFYEIGYVAVTARAPTLHF